ncbi:MAG: DUF1573 domain-containing protein [Capsulimonadaceae bacterium]|nr:DUF1573 domain-containing protein [Capsulimonadaceae bacterium]
MESFRLFSVRLLAALSCAVLFLPQGNAVAHVRKHAKRNIRQAALVAKPTANRPMAAAKHQPPLPHRLWTDDALVVVGGNRVTRIAPGNYEYTFGTLKVIDLPTASFPITLRNISSRPIHIENVTTSCGCTSAMLTAAPASEGAELPLPFALVPGAYATLLATVDASRLPPGEVRKGVYVHSDAGDLFVSLTGTSIGPAQFSVGSIAFGELTAGQIASRRIAVDLDARVASIPFRILSDDANVIVRPVDPSTASAGHREFDVSIAELPRLGQVNATLTLLSDDDVGDKNRDYSPSYIPVTAEIVADVQAMPTEAVFGLVRAGQTSPVEVRLTGSSIDISGLSFETGSPYIVCTAANRRASGGRRQVILSIGLTADVPAGSFSSHVLVTTRSGVRFAIPVSATVTKLDVGGAP